MTRAWELGSFADQEITHLAPMPGGDVIVVGDMYGTMDFGDGVVAEAYFGDDIVIARISPDGTPQWAAMATGGGMIPRGIAVGPDGTIAVVGWFQTELVLGRGGPTEQAVRDPIYTINGFLAVLEASGTPRWIRAVSGNDLSTEDLVNVAFSPDGSIWVAGSFEHETATVSIGQLDAVVISGGDASTSTADAFVAHYDANGALLGVVTLLGDGPQSSVALAPRPRGGVDWGVDAGTAVLTPADGASTPVSSESIVRLSADGELEAVMALPELTAGPWLGYIGEDLMGFLTAPVPATLQSWGAGPAVELVASADGTFSGFASWQNGEGLVSTELLASGVATIQLGRTGTAVGHTLVGDYEYFPATARLEVEKSAFTPYGVARPVGIARSADAQWTCSVDVELSNSVLAPQLVKAAALDEAGGFWLAGRFNDATLGVESSPGGAMAAELEAVAAEEYQGWLVRWQLWPPAITSGSATQTPTP